MFITITSGETPKDAFEYCRLSGKNGKEIQSKNGIIVFCGMSRKQGPLNRAVKLVEKNKITNDRCGCIPFFTDYPGERPVYLFFGN